MTVTVPSEVYYDPFDPGIDADPYPEVVPIFVEFEVAVPHLRPA